MSETLYADNKPVLHIMTPNEVRDRMGLYPLSKSLDNDIQTNCPNCGAPVNYKADKCEYCGTPYQHCIDRMLKEKEVLVLKINSLRDQEKLKELYSEAIKAMRNYATKGL